MMIMRTQMKTLKNSDDLKKMGYQEQKCGKKLGRYLNLLVILC